MTTEQAYGNLSLDGLYALHTALFDQHTVTHARMVGPDMRPVIDPLSDEWAEISARCAEISASAHAVNAEIERRIERREAELREAVNA